MIECPISCWIMGDNCKFLKNNDNVVMSHSYNCLQSYTILLYLLYIDNKCTTQAKLYPVGTTVHWTAPKDLKDCATNHVFNPKASRLSFHIQPTDKSKYYCINEVVVVLDDQKSTRFAKETDDEWRDGDNTISVPKQY